MNKQSVYYQSVYGGTLENPNQLTESLRAILPDALSSLDPVQQTGQEILDSAGQVLGYVALVANGFFTAVAILPLAFY